MILIRRQSNTHSTYSLDKYKYQKFLLWVCLLLQKQDFSVNLGFRIILLVIPFFFFKCIMLFFSASFNFFIEVKNIVHLIAQFISLFLRLLGKFLFLIGINRKCYHFFYIYLQKRNWFRFSHWINPERGSWFLKDIIFHFVDSFPPNPFILNDFAWNSLSFLKFLVNSCCSV